MCPSTDGAMNHTPVYCNVYDLAPTNTYTAWCGLGIFHAGIAVHGVEYSYGGHEYDCTGVFASNPRDAPGQVVFRESLYLGETNLTAAEVQQLVFRMGEQYRGNKYHLLQQNCNNFADDLAWQLVGRPAPSWVNRLAGLAIALHCLLPVAWVPPLQTPGVEPNKDTNPLLVSGGLRSDDLSVDVPSLAGEGLAAQHSSSIVTPPAVVASRSAAAPLPHRAGNMGSSRLA